MNDDIKVLAMLLRYSQRRMVAVIGMVESCLDGDVARAHAVLGRLDANGLTYLEGVSVRLTFPGFAQAVAAAATVKPATVHRLGRYQGGRGSRSHAA